MARTLPQARLFRFGPFELDVRAGELRKYDIRIKLREQPVQILLMLLDDPGEVVLRDEIRRRLWPNNAVVEFDHGINAAIQKLRDALGEANVAVHAVDSNGLGGPPRLWGGGVILTMKEVAERTGGQAYYHRNDLDEAIAEGIAAARDTYTLGFYLAEGERDGKYHRLEVSTDLPNLEVLHRQGYYAGADLLPPRKVELESAVLSPADLPTIGITTTLSVEPGQPRAALKARLNLDLATLTVKQLGDFCSGKIEEMFIELDAGGRHLAKVSDKLEFRFAASTRAERERQGLVLTQTLQLVEGASRLLVIVKDSSSGRVGSLTASLDKLAR